MKNVRRLLTLCDLNTDMHIRYTQNIENVWSHLKRGINGVYRIVSKKYLQAYGDEYAFMYNHRKDKSPMFDLLIAQVSVTEKIS